jgi:hypothetical protein
VGTSSSYKGSSGKIPKAMREGFEDWAKSQSKDDKTDLPKEVVAQALRIPLFSRTSGGGDGAGGTSAANEESGGRQSAPKRNISSYARTAGRAAELARAFRAGDREAIERAGLDFDSLSVLSSHAEIVRAIVDVVCAAQTTSDIASEEQRQIAGKLVDWMLDDTLNTQLPDAAETAEHAIGLIAAEIFISEAGDTLVGSDDVSRDELIERITETSQALAAQANLASGSTDADSIAKAITRGVRALRKIYKPVNPA